MSCVYQDLMKIQKIHSLTCTLIDDGEDVQNMSDSDEDLDDPEDNEDTDSQSVNY